MGAPASEAIAVTVKDGWLRRVLRHGHGRQPWGLRVDATTGQVITGLGAPVVAAVSTLVGVAMTRRSAERQDAIRVEREDRERSSFRNHELRINAATDYIARLNAFRRGVKNMDRGQPEAREAVTALAQAAENSRLLVTLYFSKTVADRARDATTPVVEMQLNKLRGELSAERQDSLDGEAKTAREKLIEEMKRQIGESP